MIWQKYSELSNQQKFMISRMYTNNDPENYLYKYDENGNFKGRTPVTEIVENKELISKSPIVEDEVKPKAKRTKKK